MSDLTEKSWEDIYNDTEYASYNAQLKWDYECDMRTSIERERKAKLDGLEAVASHATAQLQSSLQKCQGEVEELKIENEQLRRQAEDGFCKEIAEAASAEKSKMDSNYATECNNAMVRMEANHREELLQLRALLAEAMDVTTESLPTLEQGFTPIRGDEAAVRSILKSRNLIAKISAALGDKPTKELHGD